MKEPMFLCDAIVIMLRQHITDAQWRTYSHRKQVALVLHMHVMLLQKELEAVSAEIEEEP